MSICLAIDVVSFALLLFMLINASSMFEFHMLVVVVDMLNILELIMKIVSNCPTVCSLAEWDKIITKKLKPNPKMEYAHHGREKRRDGIPWTINIHSLFL
jgi:hypothetical protein